MSAFDYGAGLSMWVRYFLDTEVYDRGLPHVVSPRSGDALPYPHAMHLSQRYAHRRRDEIGLDATVPGKREAARMTFEQLRLHDRERQP